MHSRSHWWASRRICARGAYHNWYGKAKQLYGDGSGAALLLSHFNYIHMRAERQCFENDFYFNRSAQLWMMSARPLATQRYWIKRYFHIAIRKVNLRQHKYEREENLLNFLLLLFIFCLVLFLLLLLLLIDDDHSHHLIKFKKRKKKTK